MQEYVSLGYNSLLASSDSCHLLIIFTAEKHDFKTSIMAETIEKHVNSGKTSFNISLNMRQIFMGF